MFKLLILLLLSGCSFIATHQNTTQHKSSSENTPRAGQSTPLFWPDQIIARQVIAGINHDPIMIDAHIIVSVKNGNVLLRGHCQSIRQALDADAIAGKVIGVKQVIDEIRAPGRS